jgi:hypothetical protein
MCRTVRSAPFQPSCNGVSVAQAKLCMRGHPFERWSCLDVQAAAEEAFKGGKEAGQALTSDKQNVDIDVQQPGKLEVWEKKG